MATHPTSTSLPRPRASRLLYAGLTATLLALIAAEIVRRDGGYWWLAAFVMAPDLALFLGFGTGLEKGRLHPRAVRGVQPAAPLLGARGAWRPGHRNRDSVGLRARRARLGAAHRARPLDRIRPEDPRWLPAFLTP